MSAFFRGDIEHHFGMVVYEDHEGMILAKTSMGIAIFFRIDDTEEYETVGIVDVDQILLSLPLEQLKKEAYKIAAQIHSGEREL